MNKADAITATQAQMRPVFNFPYPGVSGEGFSLYIPTALFPVSTAVAPHIIAATAQATEIAAHLELAKIPSVNKISAANTQPAQKNTAEATPKINVLSA